MVCSTCEKKLSKVAAPEPYKWGDADNKDVKGKQSSGRKVGENKLLGKNKRFAPYASGAKCKICKSALHQEGLYCQACAYQKGMCSMCGKQILDTSEYKQSAK